MRLILLQCHTTTWLLSCLNSSRVIVLKKIGCIHGRWGLKKRLLLLEIYWIVLFNRVIWLLLLRGSRLNERPRLRNLSSLILKLIQSILLPYLRIGWLASLNVPSLLPTTFIQWFIPLIYALARRSSMSSLLYLLGTYLGVVFKVSKLLRLNHDTLQSIPFLHWLVSRVDLLSAHLVLLNHVAYSRLPHIVFSYCSWICESSTFCRSLRID